jgi:phenylacetate-CoA ligase
VEAINAFQPDVVHSYGSYLQILFPFIHTSGIQFHHPKVVTYSSDGLVSSVRKLITDTFGIPVFSTYQAIEAFKVGFECSEHSGLHLNMDLYPVRIIDSQGGTLPAGEAGQVVISNLVNRGTVVLNYRLGDIAAILKESCKCGRSLPLLSYPKGRIDDCIELPSGEVVHSFFIRGILAKEREVWQWQVVQSKRLCFEILLVISSKGNQEEIKTRILTQFRTALGTEPEIRISFVNSIPFQPGEKIKPIVSLKHQRTHS